MNEFEACEVVDSVVMLAFKLGLSDYIHLDVLSFVNRQMGDEW